MVWKTVSMTSGSNLSLELLIHYLLTSFPTAMAALSKLAGLHHILQAGLPANDGRAKPLHRWLCRSMRRGPELTFPVQPKGRQAQPCPHSKAEHYHVVCLQLGLSCPINSWRFFLPSAVAGSRPTICFQNHPCKADFNSGSCVPKGLQWFGSCRFAETHNAWKHASPLLYLVHSFHRTERM